ncbi:MAG: hypothetical protein E7334_06985 [Clostridiales bacterium]|nr:hypothetical protein [Clostridiales bacterium]
MSKRMEVLSFVSVVLTMAVCFALSFIYSDKKEEHTDRLYIESRVIENSPAMRIELPVAFGLSARVNSKVNNEIRESLLLDKLLQIPMDEGSASIRFETKQIGDVINISAVSTLFNKNEKLQARSELYFDVKSGKRYFLDNMFSLISKRAGMNEMRKKAKDELSIDKVSGCFKLFSDHLSLIYPRGDGSGFVSCDIQYSDINKHINNNSAFIKALLGGQGNK